MPDPESQGSNANSQLALEFVQSVTRLNDTMAQHADVSAELVGKIDELMHYLDGFMEAAERASKSKVSDLGQFLEIFGEVASGMAGEDPEEDSDDGDFPRR